MNKALILLLALILFLGNSCSKSIIPGRYSTNFSTYGMFNKTLTLNCDSTVILNFAGDLINDNSYGKWITNGETLIIAFDTINHPNSRYRNNLEFNIKGRKLYNISLKKEEYDELIKEIKESGNDTIKIPTYRKFIRQAGRSMTNFNGDMKGQYFKLLETFECEQ